MKRQLSELPPWEKLLKRIVWQQLGDIQNKKILDFGSGIGVTADHFARHNEVIAIEPNEESIANRWRDHDYVQLTGSTNQLRSFADETFDLILCHNVLEYAPDRETIVQEFSRILKKDGMISLVKHNRPGRVMQMVVLLNNFEHAHALLDGQQGKSTEYGAICYYNDSDIEKWADELHIQKTLGIRTFWDLQQNQALHTDADWQNQMVEIEMRVSEVEAYRSIAFFHHLIIRK